MFKKTLLTLLAGAALAFAAGAANAAVLTFTDQTSYNNAFLTGPLSAAKADNVDWAQYAASLGITNPNNASIPNNKSFTTNTGTNQGEQLTASNSGGSTFTSYVNQATGLQNWRGDFGSGTTILYTNANPGGAGTITLSFAAGAGYSGAGTVSGVGFDLQPKAAGAYSFSIAAYNVAGTLLGTATSSGTSTGTASYSPNTAAFAAITSDAADISYVVISSSNATSGFAIDTSLIYHIPLSQQASGGGTSTPEPGTLGLLGAGLAGLGLVRRRRNQA